MKFTFIKEHRCTCPVKVMCRVLAVSRSGFFAWLRREPGPRRQRREALAQKIRTVHDENRRVYGSPRVHEALVARGERVCVNTVAKVMREEQIRSKTKRKFVPRTTDSRHDQPVAPNLLARDFHAARPNRKWVADITYVPTDEGWLFVAAVLDLCSRRIVGWSMADHMRAQLVGDALQMAMARRQHSGSTRTTSGNTSGGEPPAGLLLHSDRGVEYACDEHQHPADSPRHHRQHEPPGRLLRQRCHGKLLGHAQDRTGASRTLHHPQSGPGVNLRVHRGVLQSQTTTQHVRLQKSPEAFEASLN